jgi:Tol biopolymer transport system component
MRVSSRIAALTVTLVGAAFVAPSVAHAEVSANAGIVVYAHDGDIFSIWPDGSNRTRLTDGPAVDSEPQVAPNGRTIAFVRADGTGSDIQLMNPDGTNVRALTSTDAPERDPVWSPFGDVLVFGRAHEFDQGYGPELAWELFAARVATGDEWRVTTNPTGEDEAPAFSPDGQSLAFQRIEIAVLQAPWIARVDVDGSDYRPLSTGEGTSPTWSWQGQPIAFASFFDDLHVNGIATVHSDGSGYARLVDDMSATWRPLWDHSGDTLAFIGRETPTDSADIYVVDPTNGVHELVTRGAEEATSLLDWGPTDAEILFAADGELYVQDRWGYHPAFDLGPVGDDADWGNAPTGGDRVTVAIRAGASSARSLVYSNGPATLVFGDYDITSAGGRVTSIAGFGSIAGSGSGVADIEFHVAYDPTTSKYSGTFSISDSGNGFGAYVPVHSGKFGIWQNGSAVGGTLYGIKSLSSPNKCFEITFRINDLA